MKEQTIHYCQADKKTGKPVIVTDMATGKRRNTKKWTRIFENKDGIKWRCTVEYKNATGKAKRSGATTMLKVEKID